MREDEPIRAQIWLAQQRLHVTKGTVFDAILVQARDHEYHPVREYLSGLTWDGKPRVDKWLVDHLGAEDTPLNRAYAAKFLIGAVSRAMRPGSKVDTILILEGPQGLMKSTALMALGDPWFTDHLPDLASKDAMAQVQGKWIIELAELTALGRADERRLRSFLSTPVDRFRPPYGRVGEDHPRQCVFAGTINPSGTGYLRDETGARRYWVTLCGVGWAEGRKIDIAGLRAVRHQLWSEAVVRFQKGEAHWLETTALEKASQAEADERHEGDAWDDPIAEYLGGKPWVTTAMVLQHALHLPVDKWTRAHEMRVAAVLTNAGWKKQKRDSISTIINDKPVRLRRYAAPPGWNVVNLPARNSDSLEKKTPFAGLIE